MSASRFVFLFASTALAFSAIAQTTYEAPAPASSSAPYSTQQVDPPARVARLAFMRGEVSFAPAGESDWLQAQLNRPLVTGDKLWTDANSRAELDIGASTVRMDQRTSFDFLNLGDQVAQMELTQGALNLAVRRVRNGESYEIDTPTLAFVADRVGDYRINVDAQANTTTVTARRGSGEIYGEGGTHVSIGEGQSLTFDNPQLRDYRTVRAAGSDDFDGFVSARDQRYEHSPSRNYVSEDVVGYEDLDDHGRWSDVSEYGHVWYPNDVAADWAPYHDGHWAWVEPWGWTWVDDAPWGFAPFHYGRWVYAESRWGWVPGPVDVRPVYAPALVAFVGGDFGINVSIGGPIGWFALGPRDVYFPGYRCGRDYFASINVSNARFSYATVNNYYGGFARGNVNYAQMNYANRNRPGALAAMPANAFASGHPVAISDLTMNSRAALANARIMPRAAVAPTRASVLAANGRANRAAPPASAMNRQVVAARTPPAAPASFAQRQRLLQRTPGQPLTTTQLHALAAQHPQRDTRIRAVANARSAAPAAQRAMARNAPGGIENRGLVHAPGSGVSARGNDRGVVDANRRATAANPQRGQLRSSDFAHAQGERKAAQARTSIDRGNAAQRQALRSSELARGRDMNAHANRNTAMSPRAQTPRNQPQMQRATAPRTENRVVTATQRQQHIERNAAPHNGDRVVAMPQHTQTPQRQQRIEHVASPRTETRAVAMPQQRELAPQHVRSSEVRSIGARPTERSAPVRQENRIATRAPQPVQQRAEARSAPPQRFNPAPANQPPRSAPPPQQQRVASAQHQNRQPPANAKKDKGDKNRD